MVEKISSRNNCPRKTILPLILRLSFQSNQQNYNMKKSFTLLSICLAFTFTAFSQNQNILLIIADDVGIDPMPNYMPEALEKANMPNLEKMMNEGVTFDNVWANPVCSPTRATILSGRYGKHTGVLNPMDMSTISTDETTLHEQIDQSSGGAYASSLIGKWHLGIRNVPGYPNETGIEHFAGLIGGAVRDYFAWSLVTNGQTENSTEYITTKFTDLAIDWINEQSQPWFCWLAYTAPHSPFHLPPANMHLQGNLPSDQASIDANPLPYYLAMLESIDFEMGRLFAAIPPDELENTTIIFIGDNGTPGDVLQAPYPNRRGKGSFYQGGVLVPMVASGAQVNRTNERESALINSSDLFTTIVELTGTDLPQIHNSFSFKKLLENPGTPPRSCIYAEASLNNNSGWTARNETYKVIDFTTGNDEFYNLIDDPYEANNLLNGTLSAAEQAAYDELNTPCIDLVSSTDSPTDYVESLKIYPNPVSNEINIFSDQNQSEFSIMDLSGRTIQKGFLNIGQNQILTEDLEQGLYFVRANGAIGKFVKM